MTFSSRLAAALVLGSELLAVAGSQQSTLPQFKTRSDLVVLDVSVLDRKRHPIKDLSAGDFTILDDGVPQQVSVFLPIDVPDVDRSSPRWSDRATTDVQSNDVPDGRLVLIYMDERTHGDSFVTNTARKIGHAVIDQLAPNDVAAVAFVVDHRVTQEFTTDRGRLHAAVDHYQSSMGGPVSMVQTLRDLALHLGDLPDRRKVVIYIGDGEPYDVQVLSTMERITVKGMPPLLPPGAKNRGSLTGEDINSIPFQFGNFQQRDTFDKLLDLFRAAQRANVTLYAIDPAGLGATVEASTGSEAACQVWYADKPISCEVKTDFLKMLASETGGRAIVKNNSPQTEVPAILTENGSYYLLGFRPTDLRAMGRFHRLQVKVNRSNVEVRGRQGYVESRAAQPGQLSPASDDGLAPLVASSDVRLRVSAIPVGPDSQSSANVALAITASDGESARTSPVTMDVSYTILTMAGKAVSRGARQFTLPAGSGDHFPSTVEMLALEHLSPGRYDVQLAAHALESGRRGQLFADVTVPDFTKDTLSVSGAIVSEIPAPHALPQDALLPALDLIPTTNRTFTRESKVTVQLRVFHNSAAVAETVTVKAALLDGGDRTIIQSSTGLDARDFSRGFAEYQLTLPLANLAPGPFLLRLEVSRASTPTVVRDVRFGVK